jgi:hypothetical protein
MQKVEGSSPFSRFPANRSNAGLSTVLTSPIGSEQ